jgi:phosphoglycerate dehydrogenase-like enzyme
MSGTTPTPTPGRPIAVATTAAAALRLEHWVREGRCPPVEVVDVETAPPSRDAQVLWISHTPTATPPESRQPARRWVPAALDALGGLSWVHTDSVGVNYLPLDDLRRRGIVLTNGGDNFARPMAEWIVLALLFRAKKLAAVVRASDSGRWERHLDQEELVGCRVLLLGLGSFHRLAAEFLSPFGVRITAWSRNPRADLPKGVERHVTGDAWRDELGRTDVLVCGLPLTAATRGLLDADALASLRPGAWLVNLARGQIVDEAALIRALDSGHLGGAVLDTFVEEPLPPDHPLWRRENVLVIPHATGISPGSARRAEERFCRLLGRFVAGDPFEAADCVDLDAGY